MKPHLDIAHRSTMGDGAVQRFGIDEKSIGHLMSVLTDLYSDPELAVIREYATNAWDSHQSAGNTAPIQVELPTPLRPTFVVRDFGTGLTLDEVMNHLTKYGWSNKRESDQQSGMLGLGFKSALTYTSQFTVKATKNGMRATVLVTRDKDGCGAIQVVDTVATSAPNGVEVQVPIRARVAEFNQKAQKFFWFWDPGTVLVGGQAPKSFFDPSTQSDEDLVLDPDLIVTTRDGIDNDYIVMGNVAYPIAWGRVTHPLRGGSSRTISGNRIVARVPIGTIDFTPSREALHLTERTLDVLESVRDYVRDFLVICAQANVESAPSHVEAMLRANKWATDFPHALRLLIHDSTSARRRNHYHTPPEGAHLLTYKFQPIPMYLDFDTDRQNVKAVDVDEFKKKQFYYSTPDSRVRKWHCGLRHWETADASDFMEGVYNAERSNLSVPFKDMIHKNVFFVYGYTKNGVTGQAKLAARDLLLGRGVKPDASGYGAEANITVYFLPAKVGFPWVNEAKFISWELLSGKKAPKRKPREQKMKWQIRNVRNAGWQSMEIDDFDAIVNDAANTILYQTPADYDNASNHWLEQGLDWADKTTFVARLRSAQVTPFLQAHPDATPYPEWAKREAHKILHDLNPWSFTLFDSGMMGVGYNRSTAASQVEFIKRSMTACDATFDDPDFARMIRCFQNGPTEFRIWFMDSILPNSVIVARMCARWGIDYDHGKGVAILRGAATRYVTEIFNRYPLLKSIAEEWGWRGMDAPLMDQLVRYANQVHDPNKFTEMVRELKSPTRRNLP